jgi:hypothetical protein
MCNFTGGSAATLAMMTLKSITDDNNGGATAISNPLQSQIVHLSNSAGGSGGRNHCKF